MRAPEDIGEESGEAATDRPVVGVVAGRDTVDAVLGITVRASARGYDVLVVPPMTVDRSVVQPAIAAGAEVVELSDGVSTVEGPRERLGSVARERGYPGVVFVESAVLVPDIEESVARVRRSDDYVVDAVGGETVSGSSVLVGIPAYNEAETIGSVVLNVAEYADAVVVVDDGSSDETALRAREAGAYVVFNETNRGYGAALKRVFSLANQWGVDTLVVIDGDGQHDAGDVPALVEELDEGGFDVVIGNRFSGDDHSVPLIRHGGLVVIKMLTNVVLRTFCGQEWLSDTQSGFRAYNSAAVKLLAQSGQLGDGMGISIDSLFRLTQARMTVGEIPTTIDYDLEGTSTHHPLIHGARLVNNLFRIIETERPVLVIGMPGVGSLALGIGFGYWTLLNYLQTPKFAMGLAITSTFFTLIGTFMVFTAIILHSLNNTVRQSSSTIDG